MSHIFKGLFTTTENQLGSTCRVSFSFMWRNIWQPSIFPSYLWCGSCSHPGGCCLPSDIAEEMLSFTGNLRTSSLDKTILENLVYLYLRLLSFGPSSLVSFDKSLTLWVKQWDVHDDLGRVLEWDELQVPPNPTHSDSMIPDSAKFRFKSVFLRNGSQMGFASMFAEI